MTPHEEEDAHVIDLTLRALPPVKPFVVRWSDSIFVTDREADPERLKASTGPKEEKAKATYRMGSAADRYGKLVEDMPPLANGRSPGIGGGRFIRARIEQAEGDCTIKEANRIFLCLANMKKKTARHFRPCNPPVEGASPWSLNPPFQHLLNPGFKSV